MKKLQNFVLLLLIVVFIVACERNNDSDDYSPCEYMPYPTPDSANDVIFIRNNDTIETVTKFSYVIATHHDINEYYHEYGNGTAIDLVYKEQYSDNIIPLYTLPPLSDKMFNAKSFGLNIYCNAEIINDYFIKNINLNFSINEQHNLSYSWIPGLSDEISIYKYEKVGGYIKGKFQGIFVCDSIKDTLKVICNFNALRWCDNEIPY